jgi:ribosomal protein S12 methylthiotransferase
LLEFIKEQKFDRLGVFAYSEEEGTKAAKIYKDIISEEIKNQRVEQIMALQQEISNEKNRDKIGKTYKTLIDRKEGENYVGRTEFDSVEVDNEVIITSENKLKIGEFYKILITDASEFDLFGVINM